MNFQRMLNLFNTSTDNPTTYPNSTQQRVGSVQQFLTLETTSHIDIRRLFLANQPIGGYNSNNRTTPISLATTSRTPFSRRQPTVDSGRSIISAITESSDVRQSMIVCVSEGRGQAKGTIGMAAIDIHSPVLILSQFDDNSNYECLQIKFNILGPIAVIVSKTIINEENRLYEMITESFPESYIREVERRTFNDSEGMQLIENFRCDDSSNIDIELKSKYYCLAACSALFKYLETFEHLIFAPKTLRVIFEGSVNTMTVDPTTARLLELIVNLNDPKSSHTVFGIINRTKTRCGYRLLRTNILQPSSDQKLIESRHQMIETIVSSESLFEGLEAVLMQFTGIDVDRCISALTQIHKSDGPDVKTAERKIDSVIVVKHIVSLIQPIVETLKLTESDVFNEFIELLSDERFELIAIAINEIIEEECKYNKSGHSMKMEKCSAIKRGFNSLLDIARDTYSENIDDVYHIIDGIKEQYRDVLPIRGTYTNSRGHHMEIPIKNKTRYRLPNEFIKVVYNKNRINFTTQELINKNNRINTSVEEIYMMSEVIISALIENMRQFIGSLYNLSEVLAKLDLVFSFASQCSIANWVRPEFGSFTAIKQGRHPILEKVLNRKPVANDIYMSEDSNFMIITGPNMSGKSTLLKQLSIHQVLAQIGSYIPAESATFRICDKLFSRIGNNDEIETNSSTFMVEMKEISYILHNLSEKSLVIIDELGRGTSVEEGVGLCFAISEHLLQTNAFTLLATHFTELTKLENFYPNVANYSFGVDHPNIEEQQNETYNFTHTLESGPTKELFYGLKLASLTAMDESILSKAHEFAHILTQRQNKTLFGGRVDENQKILYRLASFLATFIRDGQIPSRDILFEMQSFYRNQIEANLDMTDTDNDFSLI